MARKVAPVKDIDIDRLLTYNWQYYLDYDYDSDSDCEASGCNDEGICRCGTITNVRIKSVNVDMIANEICGNKDNRLLRYCVNRILNHSPMREPASWSLDVCGGYYGEEIDNAKFVQGTAPVEKLTQLLLYKNNSVDLIKAVLTNEYGFVLPELETATEFVITEVPLKNVSIGQTAYYRKLDQAIVKRYADFNLPLAICVPADDTNFRLIDGYHRIAAANNANKKNAEIIVAKYGD